MAPALILPNKRPAPATRRSTRVSTKEGPVNVILPFRMLGGGTRPSARLISQQALNAMTMREALTPPQIFTPQKIVQVAYADDVPNFASLCIADDTSDHGRSYIKLQKIDE